MPKGAQNEIYLTETTGQARRSKYDVQMYDVDQNIWYEAEIIESLTKGFLNMYLVHCYILILKNLTPDLQLSIESYRAPASFASVTFREVALFFIESSYLNSEPHFSSLQQLFLPYL